MLFQVTIFITDAHTMDKFIAMMILILKPSMSGTTTLDSVLRTYDTLDKTDIAHRIHRRSVDSDPQARSIRFVALRKTFQMKLIQSKDIFHPAFEAVSVDRHGKKTRVFVATDNFYYGHLVGDPTSRVTAHIEGDGTTTATIETKDETYVVEPMWRYFEHSPSHDMIVYKASHLNTDLQGGAHVRQHRWCGHVSNRTTNRRNHNESRREKREIRSICELYNKKENTCQVKLVADYKFFRSIGGGSEQATVHYIVQVMNRVNDIYTRTCWDSIGRGIGVQVKGIEVLTAPSSYRSEGYRFNSENSFRNPYRRWKVKELLDMFQEYDWDEYCLAHLFTYQDFRHGVVGLAYIGEDDAFGICSEHNCGVTSYLNWARPLTMLEATLVTAHEIGHNFGAVHDTRDCFEGTEDVILGRYIMSGSTVSGAMDNNKRFSKCSRKSVSKVLMNRLSMDCLKPRDDSCGNGVVDAGEECDTGRVIDHPCCTRRCKLRTGTQCSDTNHMCCTSCQLAVSGKVCRGSFPLECEGAITCTGNSKHCPLIPPKLTQGDCYVRQSSRKGRCVKGVCKCLCKMNNMVPCMCSAGEAACRVCCRSGWNDTTCRPYLPPTTEHDGVQCHYTKHETGICNNGVCVKMKESVVETFADFFTDFSLGKVIVFMRRNIVMTILMFSLLLWIPAGCVINRSDEHHTWTEYERVKDEFVIYQRTGKRLSWRKRRRNSIRAQEGEGIWKSSF